MTPARSSATTPSSRPCARASRARPAREVPSRRLRATPRASTRSRRSSCCASCRTSTAGTSSVAPSRPPTTRELEGVGDLALPCRPTGSEPVWHLYVVRTESPVGTRRRTWPRAASATGRHYPEPIHLSEAYTGPRLRARRLSGHRAHRRDCALASDLPGHDRRGSRDGRRRGQGVLRSLTRPVNDAPFRLIVDVEFGENVVVRSFTNLYGCSDRRQHHGRHLRRDSARRGRRRELQGAEPHVHLRGRDDRGRGLRRSRRDVHQRQAAARDERRGRAAVVGRLDAHPDASSPAALRSAPAR